MEGEGRRGAEPQTAGGSERERWRVCEEQLQLMIGGGGGAYTTND